MMTAAAANTASASYTFDKSTHAPGNVAMSRCPGVEYRVYRIAHDYPDDGYIPAANGASLTLNINGSGGSAPSRTLQLFVLVTRSTMRATPLRQLQETMTSS